MPNKQDPAASFFTRFLGVFVYSRRALDLVWTTSRALTTTLAVLTVVAGVLPAVIAYIGQLIVDGVVSFEAVQLLFVIDGIYLVVSFLGFEYILDE